MGRLAFSAGRRAPYSNCLIWGPYRPPGLATFRKPRPPRPGDPVARSPLNALRRWLAPAPVRPIRKTRLAVRNLEDRTVPAVTAAFTAGVLTVDSDAASDIISIELLSGLVKVFQGAG